MGETRWWRRCRWGGADSASMAATHRLKTDGDNRAAPTTTSPAVAPTAPWRRRGVRSAHAHALMAATEVGEDGVARRARAQAVA